MNLNYIKSILIIKLIILNIISLAKMGGNPSIPIKNNGYQNDAGQGNVDGNVNGRV